METKIQKTFVDEGFGFPVTLVDVPMVKVRGRWTPNVNYNEVTKEVLNQLSELKGRLSGEQIKFIRHYFEMTLEQFAERFGVSHPAVLKWERTGPKPTQMGWSTEKDIRLFINDKLGGKATRFKSLYVQLEDAAPEKPGKITLDAQRLAA